MILIMHWPHSVGFTLFLFLRGAGGVGVFFLLSVLLFFSSCLISLFFLSSVPISLFPFAALSRCFLLFLFILLYFHNGSATAAAKLHPQLRSVRAAAATSRTATITHDHSCAPATTTYRRHTPPHVFTAAAAHPESNAPEQYSAADVTSAPRSGQPPRSQKNED